MFGYDIDGQVLRTARQNAEKAGVAKAIEFIISCDDDVIIPEFGIKDIENY